MIDRRGSPRSRGTLTETKPYRVLVVDDTERIHGDFRRIFGAMAATPTSPATSMASLEQALFGTKPAPAPAPGPSFELDSALQGQQGLELVTNGLRDGAPYAIAFIDVRMPPGWNGIETTQRMWAVDPNLQVVLCTAHSDYTWSQLQDELGCTDRLLLLKKPFDSVEVLQLAMALSAKWSMLREHAALNESLEARLEARTRELALSHERLQQQIQERLQAERKTRHLQKIQALGHLCASVGHEINNPLCFVAGNLEMLALDLKKLRDAPDDPELWDEVLESVDASVNGTTRISEIVSAMRSIARSDYDHTARADVAKAIETATILTRNQLRHRARLSLVQEQVPPVRIPERELEQVLINLLINAGHATPAGHAEDHEIRIDVALRSANEVSIEISDTGDGIDPKIAPHVFDPFFTTKPIGQGTGLGLTLCREMVTRAGGDLTLTSTPGKGTTATIVLLVVEAEDGAEVPTPASSSPVAEPEPEPEPAERDQGKTKLLLIDDDPMILRMLERALRGYETRLANGGREALERCREESFDLLVCDIMMPDLSGIDVYEQLNAQGDQQADRFLFITGGVVEQVIDRFLSRPDTHCLRKPFSAQSIRDAVAQRLVEFR